MRCRCRLARCACQPHLNAGVKPPRQAYAIQPNAEATCRSRRVARGELCSGCAWWLRVRKRRRLLSTTDAPPVGSSYMALRSSLDLTLPPHGRRRLVGQARAWLSPGTHRSLIVSDPTGRQRTVDIAVLRLASGGLAFGEIFMLWVLLLCTVVAFWRVCPLAGALLIPYLAWVTFASALTYAVWQRNSALLA